LLRNRSRRSIAARFIKASAPSPINPFPCWKNGCRIGGRRSPDAAKILQLEGAIFDRLRQIVDKKMTGMRIRCHGDFHLGQVLFTGKDFVISISKGSLPDRSRSEG